VKEGVTGFGDPLSHPVVVTGGTALDAEMVSDTIPDTMTAGQSQSVSITVKNNGTQSWSESALIRLANDATTQQFGAARILIPSGTTVSSGNSYPFTYTITAPSTPGTYPLYYLMVKEGVTGFGDPLSHPVSIQ
jgi:hypothetical protein